MAVTELAQATAMVKVRKPDSFLPSSRPTSILVRILTGWRWGSQGLDSHLSIALSPPKLGSLTSDVRAARGRPARGAGVRHGIRGRVGGCAPPALLCSCSYVRRLRGLASGVVHRLRRPPASCVGPPLARVTSQQKFNREITILSEKLRNDVCHRCRTRFSSFFVLCLRATRHLYLPSMRDDLWLEYPIPPLPDFTCPHQVSKA